MRPIASACLVGALMLSGSVALAKSGANDPDFEWNAKLTKGQRVEIHGVNGDIEAVPSSGKEVEIVAHKRWKKSDPTEVRIEVVEDEHGVTVCAVYPGEGNTCEPGSAHSHTRNNDVVVDFEVRLPRGIGLVAETVNGGIDAGGLDGPVDARTVNGSIRATSHQTVTATTVNGSVSAEVGSSSWDDELKFSTVNGSITLLLPESLDADLDASTMNGDITTDFPLMVSGKVNRRHISGRIGEGGGGALALSTINGSIRLKASGR